MTEGRDRGTREYYDDFAEGYERERGRGYHGMLDDLEVEIATPYARGGRVLEVGCGTGLILARLAAVAAEARGLDLSPGMLEKARARGLDVVTGSATAIPFDDDTFDLTASFKVLAHVPDVGRALAEMARVTRPGGHIIAEFYNPVSLRWLAKKLAGPRAIADGRTEADVYTRWDTASSIRRIVPPGTEVVDFRGVRVFTPAAFVHRMPLVSAALVRAERHAVASPLRWLGGFLVAILRKHRHA